MGVGLFDVSPGTGKFPEPADRNVRPTWVTAFILLAVALLCLDSTRAVAAIVPNHAIIPGFEAVIRSENPDLTSAGQLLLGELNCIACHQPGDALSSHLLPKQAPILEGVGGRIRFDYLKSFIADPQSVKPGTTMPNLFAGWPAAGKEEAVEALAHFLSSQGGPFRETKLTLSKAELKTGAQLYHSTGCVACHVPYSDPVARESEEGAAQIELPPIATASVPLGDLRRKTTVEPLAAFLRDPLATHPSGRMPRLKLNEAEAKAVAAYLIGRESGPAGGAASVAPSVIDSKKVLRGKALFSSVGCASCHLLREGNTAMSSTLAAPALTELPPNASGCLDAAPRPGVPAFSLNDSQRAALQTALAANNLPPVTDASRIDRAMAAYNCYACHARKGVGGPEPGRAVYFTCLEEVDLGDEGRLPPHLTGVGAKLTPAWLEKVLGGSGQVRPYMATRMPDFGMENLAPLVTAFVRADEDPTLPPTDVRGGLLHQRNHYGRQIIGASGLSCISCHNLDGHRSIGIPGLDLATVPERLQPAWFKKFLLNPADIRPETRMPAFFTDGKSALSTLRLPTTPGTKPTDADKQIEALWIYLREMKETRLPEGLERTDLFELIPKERPILLRTFMTEVGTHAIAVGYPQGTHAAFDALNVRFVLAWRGRFMDAESTWSDRFTPFVEPLSEDRQWLAAGMPLAMLKDPSAPWPAVTGTAAGYRMRGYRLDPSGAPIFRYQFRNWEIEEQILPGAPGGWFQRTLRVKGPGSQALWFRAAQGKQIETGADGAFVVDGRMKVRLPAPATVRGAGETKELLMPVHFQNGSAVIEGEFTW